MTKERGYVIWESSPRVAIAVLNSENHKTGNMIQVYILDSTQHPVEAVKNGTDNVICGDCPLRSGNGCYVIVSQGPATVWKQYHAGKYPVFNREDSNHVNAFRGRSIRWGSYGDPVYIPFDVIAYFNALADNWTGYTHQWRECNQIYKNVLMASCETQAQVFTANSNGWRTFTIHNSELKPTNSIWCPASLEGGNKTHCVSCGLCNGSRGDNDPRKNIVIKPHGKHKAKFITIGV